MRLPAPLFVPKKFNAECSCPDYANPCKHIAAVFYTLADEIDYEPMLLFKLRGMSKESLFKEIGLSDSKEEEPAAKKAGKPAKKTRQRERRLKENQEEESADERFFQLQFGCKNSHNGQGTRGRNEYLKEAGQT